LELVVQEKAQGFMHLALEVIQYFQQLYHKLEERAVCLILPVLQDLPLYPVLLLLQMVHQVDQVVEVLFLVLQVELEIHPP
tara:strand:- start:224 stop:466 length:243 start_codon:yes stop_codon:yes gene_type:complete